MVAETPPSPAATLLVMARFDEVKASFWGDGDPGFPLPLSNETVRAAERELGVTLPSALLELLRIHNGGLVARDWNAFATRAPTSSSEHHIPFTELMGLGPSEHDASLLDTPYLVQVWALPSPIVLLSGDGHCWVGLDYRVCDPAGEPSVTWFDTDLDREQALADDFRSFVENLTRDRAFGHDTGDGRSFIR